MGGQLFRPPPVKIELMKPRERNKSIKKINHPSLFIAPVNIPLRSITTSIHKVVSIPYDTRRRTSGYWISFANHVIIPKPSAQAPEIRVFMIPVRFVSRPRSDKLKTGAKINKEALMIVSMAATEAIVLYFMASREPPT